MRAHVSIGRVGELAMALGAGATIALGGCAAAAAAPTDASSESGTVDAGPANGRSGDVRTRAGRAVRASSASAVSDRATARVSAAPGAAVALPSQPPSPIDAIGNLMIASAAGLKARTQSAAPAAVVTTSQTASSSAAATADPAPNPIAALLFNQTPTLNPLSTGQSGSGVVTGALNASDPDSSPLSYTVTTAPAHGSVSIDSGGNYTYNPDPSMVRAGYTDSFSVSVSDAGTGFHIHGLMGLINLLTFGLLGEAGHTSVRSVTVQVTGTANIAPTATAAAGPPDPSTGVVTGTVSASDPEGDPLSYSASGSSKGAVVITNLGDFTYTPTANARHAASSLTASPSDGLDSFIISVSDGYGGSTAVPVTVPIVPANNEPTGTFSAGTPDATTGVVAGAIIGSDADADSLGYSASTPSKGIVAVGPNGYFTYTPNAQARHDVFFGQGSPTDAFTVTVTDGHGGSVDVPVSVSIGGAGVTFSFGYDGTWTNDAQTAMNSAARSLASYFLVSAPRTIVVTATGSNAPGSNNLGSASTGFTSGGPGFFDTVAQSKIINGTDSNGGTADATINFNWGQPWSFADSVPNNRYDFKSVAIHELLHAVGFLTGSEDPSALNANWTIFDSHLTTSAGVSVFQNSPNQNLVDPAYLGNFTGVNGEGLYFNGANAGLVPLYTPGTWSPGSSVSHVNELNGYVMNPFSDTGNGTRELNPVEVGILKDIGYQVSTSPWVAAFVFLVRIRRRRR